MTTIQEPYAIGVPLSEVLQGFLEAQKLDLRESRQLIPGFTMIQTDDDNNLVNTYVAYEPGNGSGLVELGDVLGRSAAEAPRTDIVVPDSMSDHVPGLTRAAGGRVRRVVPLSEFLDGFVRPQRICSELMGDQKAKTADHGNGDANDVTAEELLLSEDDFIDDQYAFTSGRGRFQALHHLYTGWARGSSPRMCIVIAPAGHGKSKITHILAKRLARQYSQAGVGARPALPILISFGKYRRGSTSFTGLVLEALNRFGSNLLTIEGFQYLIALRRILFILDGYDELIEASPDVARDNIADFVRQAGPQSRILLTARSNFYRTSSDVVGQVGDPLLAEAEVEVVDLLPFNMKQAKEYITKRLAKVGSKSSRLMERAQQMLEIGNNLEILGSPIFLSEFVGLVEEDTLSIPDVRKLGGLEFLIKRTFNRERTRQDHDFSDDQQRWFLEAIAFDLLTSAEPGYPRDDLEIFASEVANEEQLRQPDWPRLWNALASHHFLLPDDDNVSRAKVTMRHQVWREYFQGSAVAARLDNRNRNSRRDPRLNEGGRTKAFDLLTSRDLPEGVLRSAAAHMSDSTRGELLRKLKGSSSDKLVRNVLRTELLRREPDDDGLLVLPDEISVELTERDLSGIVFTRVWLDGSLAGANLTGCLFDRCDLSGVIFRGALLKSTTFSGCELSATLAKADVASVMIDGEALFGPQVRQRYADRDGHEQGTEPDADGPGEFRDWVIKIITARLARFLQSRGGEANAIFDTAISWTHFMGGVDPKHRDFVVRRAYRAMRAEKLVSEVPTGSGPRPVVLITKDPVLRAEVLALVRNGQVGGSIDRVVNRLTTESLGRLTR